MMKMTKGILSFLAMCASSVLFADTITTQNGDVINGKITGIKGGKVSIDTTFAGSLAIDQSVIKSIAYETEAKLYARTDASNENDKQLVTVSTDAAGNTVLIPEGDKAKALSMSEVSTLWEPSGVDPDFPPVKRWAYSVSLGFSGTSGATKDLTMSAYADAVRTGESTTLKLYASMNKARTEGIETEKRYIGGIDFEHRPTAVISWYVRDEAQHNRYNDYKLRNVFGAGLGFYFWNTKTEGRSSLLRFRTGLAHTYTEHYTKKRGRSDKNLTDSDLALDFGLLFHHDFKGGLSWNTEITYTPTLDDFSQGTVVHETKLSYIMNNLTLISDKLGGVSLDLGIRNEYQTEVAEGANNTDTTWYLRFSKSW